MAGSVLVDAGFLIALVSRRDRHHRWAAAQSPHAARPWKTCEAALSEAFHLLGPRGEAALAALLRRRAVVPAFDLGQELERVLKLMQKCGYPDESCRRLLGTDERNGSGRRHSHHRCGL